MKKFFYYFNQCRFYYGMTVLVSILLTGAIILASNVLGELTEKLSGFGADGAGRLLILVAGAFLLQELLDAVYQLLKSRIECYTFGNIQKKLLHQILYLSPDHPEMKNSSGLYTLMVRHAGDYTGFLSDTVPNIIFQTIRLVLVLVYIALVDWRSTVVYVAAILVSMTIQFFISRIMEKASYDVKKCEAELNTKMKDALGSHTIIKVWGCFDWIEDYWKSQEALYIKANIRMGLRTLPVSMIGLLCGILPILCLCLAGLWLIPAGLVETGAFMGIFYLCQNILPDQLHYTDLWTEAAKARPSGKWLMDFFGEPVRTVVSREEEDSGDVAIERVWYRYPGNEKWVLTDISLQIEAGKKIALVGASGSGKTTLMKLIAGLLCPQKGKISGKQAVYGDQFPYLFTDTIRRNILYSCDKEDDFFRQVCEDMQLNEFVSGQKEGYETQITENGDTLSGGQRQRIALARALNSRRKILLLDEAFSALDPGLAKRIMKKLVGDYPETTMIFGLHQKELLPFMDEIYLLRDGKLLAHGSYKELCERNMISGEVTG